MSRALFDSLDEVAASLARADSVLLCLDFDGTLAPLVDDPAKATLNSSMRSLLTRIAGNRNVTLAIMSGRGCDDLLQRINLPGIFYGGNHGLEIRGHGLIFVEPNAVAFRPALQAVAAELSSALQELPGAFVEDKGLTVSVHYRCVEPADMEELRRVVHITLAKSPDPFRLNTGDMVFEIKPRVSWNKGRAIGWIKKHLEKPPDLIIYVGDDRTDEDAFAVLPDGVTVKVGEENESKARYRLPDQESVGTFLSWLESTLGHGTPLGVS
jgi:trehalose 6-phosphate phosphatase